MYHLEVFHAGKPRPTETIDLERASAVLDAIPRLLGKHPDCARVEVWNNSTRLFAVDCEGNRLP